MLVAFGVAVGLAWVRGKRAERLLGVVAAAALASAFVVVALTAYGSEHLQLLAYPATLVAAALIWRVDALFGWRAGAIAATVVAAFACWTTFKAPVSRDVSPLWTGTAVSPGAIALERARTRFQPEAPRVEYMVLGSNSEGGHAAFIDPSFELACRYFHLYLFSRSEQFEDTLACAARESPTFVLVTLGFFEPAGNVPEWNGFVLRARRLLEAALRARRARASGRAGVEAPVGVTRRSTTRLLAGVRARDAGRAATARRVGTELELLRSRRGPPTWRSSTSSRRRPPAAATSSSVR